jgi:hypothetical protein
LNDISVGLSHSAFRNTSHTPERQGDSFRAEYAAHLERVADRLATFRNADNEAAIAAAFESYRAGYKSRAEAYLSAHSRCASSFITGPSGFAVEQQRKCNETADKRLDEWIEWSEKSRERLNKQFNPAAASDVIRSDADDALDQLRAKLAKLEELQERMKAINKVCRAAKTDEATKTTALTEMGCNTTTIHNLLHPDWGQPGFEPFQLSNNNAEIRRVKARLAALEAEHARRDVIPDEYALGSARVVENAEAERLQLFFDGKPEQHIIDRLKSRGFNWSRTNRCWQRLLNDNARAAARWVMEA